MRHKKAGVMIWAVAGFIVLALVVFAALRSRGAGDGDHKHENHEHGLLLVPSGRA